MKILLAIAALSIVSASPPPEVDANGYFIPLDLVRQLKCYGTDGGVTGSGTYIDGDLILSAYHVVSDRKCKVDGAAVETVYVNKAQDIAVVKTPYVAPSFITISCAKPKAGDEAFAVGFANGEAFVVQRYTATGTYRRGGKPFGGLAVFKGTSFHGMSGGPVLDSKGQIIATLNAGNDSGVMLGRLMGETYLCRS